MKTQKKYTDKDGNEIPSSFIHKIDREKHAAAVKLAAKAEKISKVLTDFKTELMNTCDQLFQKALDENRVTLKKNSVGGYSISTIDKMIKIEITISETISFDDNITIAQAKIKQYLDEKTMGIDQDLHLLVNEAFKTRKGSLDTKRVLGLLKLNIQHTVWKEAMDLIQRSIQTNDTKRYARIWKKRNAGDGYDIINLDFASIKH